MTRTKLPGPDIAFAVFFAVLAISFVPSASQNASLCSADLTDRGPILINDDSKFTSDNGVVSGNGTAADPFMIEGWMIGPFPNSTAITIQNTSAYFTIRNVHTFSCSIGVFMNEVRNGRVEDSQFTNDTIGVAFYESTSCKVIDSTFEGSDIGISIAYSGVSQSGNTFINNVNDVVVKKNEQPPWEFTWMGTVLWAALLTFFVAVVAIMIYFRFKRYSPPVG